MSIYKSYFDKRKTAQNQPIPGRECEMVQNDARGYGFAIDDWTRLRRFLFLGNEGGTYYCKEGDLIRQSATSVLKCIQQDGIRVVKELTEISLTGRAPKNDPAILVLALCFAHGDVATKQAAYEALPKVCRTGTHLFSFCADIDGMRGWGRQLRSAVANWYLSKDANRLALQICKYAQRNGWNHRDALRLSHPKSEDPELNNLLKYTVDRTGSVEISSLPSIVQGFEKAKNAQTAEEVCSLIQQHELTHEMLPTQFKTEREVWETLLKEDRLPMAALIRNLGNLAKCQLLAAGQYDVINTIADRITDPEAILKSRIHPIDILKASMTFAQGHGMRGSGEWEAVPQIKDALSKAFQLAYGNVETTGKRYLLAIDGSGSMYSSVNGLDYLLCADIAAAMALVLANTEPNYTIVRFTTKASLYGSITPGMNLDSALHQWRNDATPQGTDCASPILLALEHRIPVDVFVLLTDNQTWAGSIHPAQALAKYRDKMGIPARCVAAAMADSHISTADQKDPLSLDIVGFDTSMPALIAEFVKGTV